MSDELKNAMVTNATGPKSASSDAGSVQQHSLAEQIALDKHLASKSAGSNPAKALRFAKIVSPGSV